MSVLNEPAPIKPVSMRVFFTSGKKIAKKGGWKILGKMATKKRRK